MAAAKDPLESWSKKFGTGAAGMLEAEVVTADGARLVANACRNQELFWALRGGGGGTFGVVTKVTLRTHPIPATFGLVAGTISATGDAAFRDLLEQFLLFYREHLGDEHWGEQVKVRGDKRPVTTMTCPAPTGRRRRAARRPPSASRTPPTASTRSPAARSRSRRSRRLPTVACINSSTFSATSTSSAPVTVGLRRSERTRRSLHKCIEGSMRS